MAIGRWISQFMRGVDAYLMGYDVFVSYAWKDGRPYAENLVAALRDRGFRCFLDSTEYKAGADLNRDAKRAVQLSSTAAVVVTPFALRSRHVRNEIRLFDELQRPLVPIDVAETMYRRELDNGAELRWIASPQLDRILSEVGTEEAAQIEQILTKISRDSRIQIAEGATDGPSPATVAELIHRFSFTRTVTRRLRLISFVCLLLAFLIGVALWAGIEARRQRDVARREARISEAGRLAAESARVPDRPQLSALLASSAIHATCDAGEPPTLRAEQALRDALNRLGGQGLGAVVGGPEELAFLYNSERLLSINADGGLCLWKTPPGPIWSKPNWTTPGMEEVERLQIGKKSFWGISAGFLFHWTLDGQLSRHKLPSMRGLDEEDEVDGLDYAIGHQQAWRCSSSLGRLEGFPLEGPFDEPSIQLTIDDAGFNRSLFGPLTNRLFVESFDGALYVVELGGDERAPRVSRLAVEAGLTVEAVAFHPRGESLAAAFDDQTVRIWNLSEGQASPSTRIHVPGPSSELCLAETHAWLLAVHEETAEGTSPGITLFDLSESPPVGHQLPHPAFDAKVLEFSPDESWLVLSDGLRAVSLADLRQGLSRIDLHALQRHPSPEDIGGVVPAPVRFSPDSRWLATVSDDNRAHLWFLRSEHPTANHLILNGHDDAVFTLAFDEKSRWLATGSYDQTIRLWDLQRLNTSTWSINLRRVSGGRILRKSFSSPFNPVGGIELVRFTPSSNRVLFWGEHGKVELWRIDESGFPELERHFAEGYPFMSKTGRWLLVRRDGVDDELIDLQAGHALESHSLPMESSAWSFSDGDEFLICGDRSGNAKAWKLDDRPELVYKTHVTDQEIDGIAITPDGRHTVFVVGRRAYWQHRAPDGSAVETDTLNLDDLDDVFGAVEVSADGQTCLIGFDHLFARSGGAWQTSALPENSGSTRLGHGLFLRTSDESTGVLDLNSVAQRLRTPMEIVQHEDAFAEAYHADSGVLAISVEGGAVSLYQRQGDEFVLQTRFSGEDVDVRAVAVFSADRIATGERDGTVRLWRRRDHQRFERLTLGRHRGGVNALEFSPDGAWLASGGEDNDVLLFPIGIERLLDSAETAVGRGYTDVERNFAFPEEFGTSDDELQIGTE